MVLNIEMTKIMKNNQCQFIYEEWHSRAKSRDIFRLIELYALDAVLESPLVPVILDDKENGILVGHEEILRFLNEGTKRRPDDLVRRYRTGSYFSDGNTLSWEYPRETPEGEQIDILEVMEIVDGLIQKHRIYWGWKGCSQIVNSLMKKRLKS